MSSYLEYPQMRRKLEELGYDSYVGEDGYLYAAVVWDPELIAMVTVGPLAEVEPSP